MRSLLVLIKLTDLQFGLGTGLGPEQSVLTLSVDPDKTHRPHFVSLSHKEYI